MFATQNMLSVILMVLGFLAADHSHDEKKRILLGNEPSVDIDGKLAQMQAQINALKQENEQLKQTVSKGSGSVYVRWGRTVCPSTSSIVYTGYTAGRYFTESGSGTDNLCLPSDPTWSKYVDGLASSYRGYIYGTEIDTNDNDHIFNYPVNQQDVPCVVCRSAKPAVVMIPARNNCYPGWTEEYSGYLMAGYHGNQAYDHVCMDASPEFLQHGSTDDNQHILYLIEGRCGSLPCPPYVNGRELACVYVNGISHPRGYIYGTEIDTDDNSHILNYPVNEQDMPCVVCRSVKPSTVMIPARNNCYPGWTEEYSGYLMAGYHDLKAYNHVCMDASPGFLQQGSANDNQHILYLIESRCGSLPCPPYVDGGELACVVCSK